MTSHQDTRLALRSFPQHVSCLLGFGIGLSVSTSAEEGWKGRGEGGYGTQLAVRHVQHEGESLQLRQGRWRRRWEKERKGKGTNSLFDTFNRRVNERLLDSVSISTQITGFPRIDSLFDTFNARVNERLFDSVNISTRITGFSRRSLRFSGEGVVFCHKSWFLTRLCRAL